MRVCVVGAGYVGLVTAACLADRGQRVVCVDVDAERVAAVRRGDAPFHEPGLAERLARNAGGRLDATTDLAAAVRASELTLICVGTPFDGRAIELRFVEAAAREIGEALRGHAAPHVVAVKSTVVPGTTDRVVRPILEAASGRRAGDGLGIGSNPEFLTEGEAVGDFERPDRIVLGGCDEATRDALARLYESFEGVPLVRCNNATAEMIKYASNALLATLISFSNELANLGAAIGGIDTVDVSRGLGTSRYLALPGGGTAPIHAFLLAGCGFGGSCLPKDVAALVGEGRRRGQDMALLDAVLRVNAAQPARVVALLEKHFADLAGVRVSILGLAFRPDTDDVRESPAIPIVQALAARGARLRGYDPVARASARRAFGDALPLCASLDEALADCDAAVLVTRWPEFATLPERLAKLERQPLVVDGRRMLAKDRVARYEGIGL
ncbi:MAG: GDP-mannose dehydrogenase [Proteobacteria bacterium]|nr:MAG: GDP-mannose dehydrogenase [Pseudomonadota bacterium]